MRVRHCCSIPPGGMRDRGNRPGQTAVGSSSFRLRVGPRDEAARQSVSLNGLEEICKMFFILLRHNSSMQTILVHTVDVSLILNYMSHNS